LSLESRKKALTPLLIDPEEMVRAAASRALDHVQGMEHLGNLAMSAMGGEKSRRLRAIHLLADLANDGAVQTLLSLLGDADPDIRVTAVRGLRRRLPTRAIIPLAGALDDPHPSVVAAALETLSQYQDDRVTELIVPTLGSPDPETAGAAADALGRNGNPAGEPHLIERLTGAADPWLRSRIAEAIGNLRLPG
jgi:HEAT repeat protein